MKKKILSALLRVLLKVCAAVSSPEQAQAALSAGADRLVCDMDAMTAPELLKLFDICAGQAVWRSAGRAELFIALPAVFRQETMTAAGNEILKLAGLHPDGWLVRTVGELEFLKQHDIPGIFAADAGIWAMNSRAAAVLKEAGFDEFTYSPELSSKDITQMNEEMTGEAYAGSGIFPVYGRVPLMISANCVRGDASDGRQCQRSPSRFTELTDRKGARLPVRTVCRRGYSIIFNSVPTYLLDMADQMPVPRAAAAAGPAVIPGPAVISCVFTDEDPEETGRIVREAVKLRDRTGSAGSAAEDVSVRSASDVVSAGFTRGHFRKGAE